MTIARNEKGQFIKGHTTGYGFKKGMIPWNKGKKTGPESEETRRKKSLAKMGIPMSEVQRLKQFGSGNPNWRGGLSHSRGYIYEFHPDHPRATSLGYVALKMGIYGEAGSGKSFTSSLVAIGLHKLVKAKKDVFFMDSETGSDYLIPMFEKAKVKLKVAKTRAFSDLLEGIKYAEKNASIFLVDSLTHYWDDLVESYKKKKKIQRMQIQNWMDVKPVWRDFSTILVMSGLHVIICGRAGDVWENVIDGEGYAELKKTGTKMRLEKETSYEPSLLVEMVKVRENSQPGAGWTHRAWVVKDRFDVIDSQHFDNPTFESFLPHIELLALGGEHKNEFVTVVFIFRVEDGAGNTYKHRESLVPWSPTYQDILIALGGELDEKENAHLGDREEDLVGRSFEAEIIHAPDKDDPTKTWARVTNVESPETSIPPIPQEEEDVPMPNGNNGESGEPEDEIPF